MNFQLILMHSGALGDKLVGCSSKTGGDMKIKDEKFWAKVQRNADPSVCWHWTGALDCDGYGKLTRKAISSQPIRVHKYAFYLFHGRWPDGPCCHSCGDKACVRPSHLHDDLTRPAPGKTAEEMYDIGNAVQKRYARSSRVNGMSALAREFGVSPKFIRLLIE